MKGIVADPDCHRWKTTAEAKSFHPPQPKSFKVYASQRQYTSLCRVAQGVCFKCSLFTEVPHDITAQTGEDVEMACSFIGSGSPSYSLEIQWWYIRNHKEWTEKQSWTSNQIIPEEDISRDATKISVVKVAGSNISHKLRLSSVKPSDEGTYECRVIDFSDSKARHHKVRAYLQVEPSRTSEGAAALHLQEIQGRGNSAADRSKQLVAHSHQKGDRELKKRSVEGHYDSDCSD
ncbi:V-set and transmembrane domain-containing protein 2-like protein isoform X1 [Polypterus senegalus]|uniref:V-set and transmembrane domain-containing protein 2-like protein isoform X1 n=1 Tax=Polypterus senegalus TaxID=55291 RepID=UPI0019663F7B|nr:V-set and transmembrane domain-containing protein 2-like protein isoform X1 [Polypterus senegalus]